MKSQTDTIISALRVLARDIHTDDGVVNACLEVANARQEPSRLEIAAMLLAATYASNHVVLKAAHALQKADELIAAAKEVK